MSPTSIGLAGGNRRGPIRAPSASHRLRRWFRDDARYDLPSSLVVFLVAVPLSLGIAAASNAPVAAGLIAAVVGGIVAGLFGGSALQVTGPAAGLTVVVAELVSRFGWATTCAITAAAGLLQVGFGLCRIARTALALSPAIVHGMLAGIGLTIVLGQLHVLLGGEPGSTPVRNLIDLPAQLATRHDHAALIGLTVIGLLVIWPRLPAPVRRIPGPLVAVTLATLAALVWNDVDLARVEMPGSLLAAVHLPTLPAGDWPAVAAAVLTVAVIASVESLLSATAVDRLAADRARDDRRSNPTSPTNLDREMIGQGLANGVSGLLGGLPVTGVIVRSSTNVNAGARTRASAVLHGVWVLLFAVLLVVLVERIPLAALAGLLVVVGLQLVKISDIRRVRRHRELAVYVVTALGVVVLNLLEGVLVGLALAVVLILRRVVWARVHAERVRGGPAGGEHWSVHVEGTLSFLAIPRLSVVLGRVPPGSTVDLELVTDFLDHAAYDHLDSWVRQHETTGGRVRLDEVGPAALRGDQPRPSRRIHALVPPRWFSPWSSWQARHPDGAGEPSHTGQVAGSAQAALRPLHVGVREYHRRSAARLRPFLTELDGRHRPYSAFLTCADALIVPNVITSSGPGDLFTVRNLGNLVPADHPTECSVTAAISYAVEVLSVPALLVCGHSGCGAMQGLLGGRDEEESHVGRWLRWGRPSLAAWRAGHPVGLAAAGDGRAEVDQLAMVNVARQVTVLRQFLAARGIESGKVSVQGLFFDIPTGLLLVLDEQRQRFTSPPDHELEISGAGFVRP